MKLIYGAYTDKGVREENQDSTLVLDTHILKAFAVGDGIGGLDYGRQAASIVVNALKKELEECDVTDSLYLQELLKIKMKQINEYMFESSKKNHFSMGTTISVLVFAEERFILGNVGDTKIFMVRDGTIDTISKVHSLRERKNVLTMAIGPDSNIDPYTVQGEVREGDIYIICSDGIYNFVAEDELRKLFHKCGIMSNEAAEQLCRNIVQLALSYGSEDNLSIIAIHAMNEQRT
ncbi:PP2C family protein-serine/threonine phosphatase [Lutispora sp.]|uniref:PP2C family protein-serine/threonine phosphatase n=1 Tax=Lutispora sp. TaxID=2828727 RepID=UPI0035670A92